MSAIFQKRSIVLRLKLSSFVEGNVEENQSCYMHTAINATTATTKAKGI
jgi:hypothetical protein